MAQLPFAQMTGIALNAEGATAPAWVQLVPAGPEVVGRDGRRWRMDDPMAVVAAFTANRAELPIDIEHATQLKGGRGEPAPAVGWIEALEARAGAIWGRVAWNAEGAAAIAARAYRYLSPTFRFDPATGAILALRSAGLTNVPNLHLEALNRAADEETDPTMDKTVLEALGLKPEASAADAVVAIGALKAARDTALNSAAHPDPSMFVPAAQHQLALNRIGEFEAADQARAEAENVAAVDEAVEKGKIPPALKDHYLALCRAEPGRTRALLKDMRSLIAPSGADRRAAPAAGPAGLGAEDLAMCRSMNITPEAFAAFKAADQE